MTNQTNPEALSQFIHPTQTVLTQEEKDIIGAISRYVVNNNHLLDGTRFVDRVLQENLALSELRHGLIVGDAGCGKTTLLDLMKHRFPREDKRFRLGIHTHFPMLSFQLPSPVTPKSMAKQMLRAFGDTSRLSGNCFELTERVCGYINECHVQVVFLDELQHLFGLGRGRGRSKDPTARLIEARNWIKALVNNSRATFILMGVPGVDSLIENDEELNRRFTHIHLVQPFALPSERNTDLIEFIDDILVGLITALPHFKDAEFLCDRPHEAIRLHIASGGVPSRLKDLLIAAALTAYRRRSPMITMADFTAGFQTLSDTRAKLFAERARAEARRKVQRQIDERRLNPFTAPHDQIQQLAMQLVT